MSRLVQGKYILCVYIWIIWLFIFLFATGVFIVGTKRTAFGTYGGKLAKSSLTELQTVAAKAALAAANVSPEAVDSVVIGNVLTVSIKKNVCSTLIIITGV